MASEGISQRFIGSSSSHFETKTDSFARFEEIRVNEYYDVNEDDELVERILAERKLIKGFAVSVVNFDFHYVIGTGGQGQVWMARKLDGVDKDRLYAIKVMVKVANNCWGRESNTFNERNGLLKVRGGSPFFVNIQYAFETQKKMYLVMDFVPGKNLNGVSNFYQEMHVRMSENTIKRIVAEILVGLQKMHEFDIIYRDLKLDNVLFTQSENIVLCDFGLCCRLREKSGVTSGCIGTSLYMAPEMIVKKGMYNNLIDYWALGIVICRFLDVGLASKMPSVQRIKLIYARHVMPYDVSSELESLLFGLLTYEKDNRLSGEKVTNHPFFNGVDWNAIKSQPALKLNKWDDLTEENRAIFPANAKFTDDSAAEYRANFAYVAPEFRVDPEDCPSLKMIAEQREWQLKLNDDKHFFKQFDIVGVRPIASGEFFLCFLCTKVGDSMQKMCVKIQLMENSEKPEGKVSWMRFKAEMQLAFKEDFNDGILRYAVFEILDDTQETK